jgi:transcriptional regulator with XRE-family HTH domain
VPDNRDYSPQPGEKIGGYLKRLREAAGEVQSHPIKQKEVAEMSAAWPDTQNFSGAWLSMAEADEFDQPGAAKLKTLATIYSRLLRTTIPEEWLLKLANYEVEQPVVFTRPTEDSEIAKLLENNDLLALLITAGVLAEMQYESDVKFLLESAQRLLKAHCPDLEIERIYKDPILSAHVKNFMREVGLE